jgi:1-acyl-sn-glycerol-3-phosphate acyltransferase
MTLPAHIVNATLKGLTHVLCRIEDQQLSRVPRRGPLIFVGNHVNFLEIPILYTHLLPRPITGFAKAESWENPAKRFLFDLWGAIPLERGEPDLSALRRALRVLEEGGILAVAPEGTRSRHGRLQRGHAGIAWLALRSGAPVLPIAYHGGEQFWENFRRLQRTDFHIHVGQWFHLQAPTPSVPQDMRQRMADEVMYQIAALLPPRYRGVYADLTTATETYLRFPPGATSNLQRATGSHPSPFKADTASPLSAPS